MGLIALMPELISQQSVIFKGPIYLVKANRLQKIDNLKISKYENNIVLYQPCV
jgi:hypothetical protein